MLYARVVLGLPVEGPFDYIVPSALEKRIKPGVRVWVSFRTKKMLGYIVELTHKTNIKNLKKILEIIDDYPILDKNMLLLTKELSNYYCCSWGEAIETALPEGLRRGRRLEAQDDFKSLKITGKQEAILLHDIDGKQRWEIYFKEIKQTLDNNKSVVMLFSNIDSVLNAKKNIETQLGLPLGILYRKKSKETEEWEKIRQGKVNIVIGTRSGIFSPVRNLGLIIIDEEQDPSYKQVQVPHYNPREIAFMRQDLEKTKLILGSTMPSLESFFLAKKNKIKLIQKVRNFPETKIIDMKYEYRISKQRDIILSKYLQDLIISNLSSGGKILLFLNRKGFATFASCRNCRAILKCPRCNINLVYHFKEGALNCHYCNFKMFPPQICPICNSGYIKYSGIGTEKMESELSRLFPQARVKRIVGKERLDINAADIFVATSAVIKQTDLNFDLIGVLAIDNSLNQIDFRSAEKTIALIMGLAKLTQKKLVIQTRLPNHYCFEPLMKKDINIFYDEELEQRKQLHLPPYRHIVLVKLRGKNEDKVKKASLTLFERLNKCNKVKEILLVSVNQGEPPKLRGNFRWQILISSKDVKKVTEFLRINLKKFSPSGIIVTVNVDPV